MDDETSASQRMDMCCLLRAEIFKYHSLRHFATALMARKNTPLKHLQLILGHKWLSTTEI